MAQRVSQSLQGGQDEETLEPHVLVDHRGRPIGRFQEGDSVIFYNLRGGEGSRALQELFGQRIQLLSNLAGTSAQFYDHDSIP